MKKNKIILDVGSVILKAPKLKAVAEEIAELYANYGGPNFLMFDIATEDGLFSVTFQPVQPGTESPTTILANLQSRVTFLENEIDAFFRAKPKGETDG